MVFPPPWQWQWRPTSSSSSPIYDIAIYRRRCHCTIHLICQSQPRTNLIADQRGRNRCLKFLGKISRSNPLPFLYTSQQSYNSWYKSPLLIVKSCSLQNSLQSSSLVKGAVSMTATWSPSDIFLAKFTVQSILDRDAVEKVDRSTTKWNPLHTDPGQECAQRIHPEEQTAILPHRHYPHCQSGRMGAWIDPICIPQDHYLEMPSQEYYEACVQRDLSRNMIHCTPRNILPKRRSIRFLICITQNLSFPLSFSLTYYSSSSSFVSSLFSALQFSGHIYCCPHLPGDQCIHCQHRHHWNWAYLFFNHFINFVSQTIVVLGGRLGS